MKKCAKMRVKLFSMSFISENGQRRLIIMGPRLESLRLHAMWYEGWDLSTALWLCTYLRNLHVSDGRLFSCPSSFPSLRVFRLQNFDAELDIILEVASKTSSLCEFAVDTRGLLGNGTVFESIVNANNDLCCISVSEPDSVGRRRSEDALKILTELVNTFSKCRKLDFNIVTTEGCIIDRAVGQICGVLPCRGVEMTIQIGDYSLRRHTSQYRSIIK